MTKSSVEVGGVNLVVDVQGEGEPVLLLHGFPDSGYLWRNQVPALLAAGYQTIVPDLRGFGDSDKPQDKESYSADKLLGDVTGILDHVGVDRVHVVSHDWGAFVGWSLSAFVPDRVKSLIAMAVGHPASFSTAGFEQREKSWYMLLFQFDVAEELLQAEDWQLFRGWTRNHSEVEHWIRQLSREGALTAALNWYRANVHPANSVANIPMPNVQCPTLSVWGSWDAYLTETQVVGSAPYVDGTWRYERIDGASHWMQLDQPERVNQLLVQFLAEQG
jgi:pimeloyl-ACP methyl ester carboxylesterase